MQLNYSQKLIQLGFLLFLLGLITGFAIPLVTNPRVALSSHLEGILNGLFLIGLGLVWQRLQLGNTMKVITFGLSIYGTFANWLATLLSAIWGAGALSMPIASHHYQGTEIQEILIKSLLLSLSIAMVFVCIFVIWGLRTNYNSEFQFNKADQTDLSLS